MRDGMGPVCGHDGSVVDCERRSAPVADADSPRSVPVSRNTMASTDLHASDRRDAVLHRMHTSEGRGLARQEEDVRNELSRSHEQVHGFSRVSGPNDHRNEFPALQLWRKFQARRQGVRSSVCDPS